MTTTAASEAASAFNFVTAIDDLMMVTAGLTALGVLLAFRLRSGPAPSTGGPAVVEA